MNGKKVLLITNIPTPYRIPLFNELEKQLKDKGIKLKVIFGALGYSRRKWINDMSECSFDYEVLATRKIPYANPERSSFTYSGLYKALSKENPSVVITNGFSIATTKIWWRSLFATTPYIIWSGDILRENTYDSFLKKLQRIILVNRAKGFIVYGTKAKEYLISLGANPEKIEIGINTVDTKFFVTQTSKYRNELNDNKKKKKSLLYIGHLTFGKRIDQLFMVIKKLLLKRQDFILELVGDGPEKNNLIDLANDLKIRDFVRFDGFKQKSDIPKYLARTDCFLFPSEYDVWGLVLVEAMAASVPCISSVYSGATEDLIKDGITGLAMDFSETEKVAEQIDRFLENPELSKEIGQNASDFMSKHVSLEKSASGFVKAIVNSAILL